MGASTSSPEVANDLESGVSQPHNLDRVAAIEFELLEWKYGTTIANKLIFLMRAGRNDPFPTQEETKEPPKQRRHSIVDFIGKINCTRCGGALACIGSALCGFACWLDTASSKTGVVRCYFFGTICFILSAIVFMFPTILQKLHPFGNALCRCWDRMKRCGVRQQDDLHYRTD
uniref:LITAF domain-containing protein n=1 Tax=Caenorhabditis tropicalis TaxID=1561998 RepID=A0A1I7UR22_9PELO